MKESFRKLKGGRKQKNKKGLPVSNPLGLNRSALSYFTSEELI